MPSNINPNNINGAYPVAGVDNDSQGFRTNFTNILNNFAFAQAEISDLQSKAILKSALTGTTLDNNMAGAVLSGVELRNSTQTRYDNGTISGSLTVDYTNGSYQQITTGGTVTITLTNFGAAGKMNDLTLKIIVTSSAHTITFTNPPTGGVAGVDGWNGTGISYTSLGAGTYYYQILTDDQGATTFIHELSGSNSATNVNISGGNVSGLTSFVASNTQVMYSNVTNVVHYPYYANVSNNFTLTANTSTLIIDSIKVLNVGNVYLPNAAFNGQEIRIASNNAIQTLYIIPNSGSIMGNITTLAANSQIHYSWVGVYGGATVNKWFKV